jgi:hypothetical protein
VNNVDGDAPHAQHTAAGCATISATIIATIMPPSSHHHCGLCSASLHVYNVPLQHGLSPSHLLRAAAFQSACRRAQL